jgi:dihydrofolate reductase
MSKVTTGATMSLDGYIAGPDESHFDLLFRWYQNGDVPVDMGGIPVQTTPEDAEHIHTLVARTGALVVGRHLYDMTGAWGGRHPMDVPVVVLTHRPPQDRPAADENFVFVTEGIEAAVATARQIAGDQEVGLNGGQIARQALAAGLVDEVHIDLVPYLLGQGTPFFPDLEGAPYELEHLATREGKGVTHLSYRVTKPKQ